MSGGAKIHLGARANSGAESDGKTQTLDKTRPYFWFLTGTTFADNFIGPDLSKLEEVGKLTAVRPTWFIPVMAKNLAALFDGEDPPASVHRFIVVVYPGTRTELQLKMELTLQESGEPKTVEEVFTLGLGEGQTDFVAIEKSSLHMLPLLFVFGEDTRVEDIDFGNLWLVDVTDDTPHGFAEEVKFSCEGEEIQFARNHFHLLEVLPELEVTEAESDDE